MHTVSAPPLKRSAAGRRYQGCSCTLVSSDAMADTADMFVCDDLPAIACLPAGEASYRCTGTGDIRHACRGTVSGPSPHVIFNFIIPRSPAVCLCASFFPSEFVVDIVSFSVSETVFREDMVT